MRMNVVLGMALALVTFAATTQAKDDVLDRSTMPSSFIKEYAEGCISVVGRPDRELLRALSKLSRAELVFAKLDGVFLVEASVRATCGPLVSAKKIAELGAVVAKCENCPPGGGWILIDSWDHKTKMNDCVTINTTTTVYVRNVDGKNEVHSESSSEFLFNADMECIKE